jgi:hypothetical protein
MACSQATQGGQVVAAGCREQAACLLGTDHDDGVGHFLPYMHIGVLLPRCRQGTQHQRWRAGCHQLLEHLQRGQEHLQRGQALLSCAMPAGSCTFKLAVRTRVLESLNLSSTVGMMLLWARSAFLL